MTDPMRDYDVAITVFVRAPGVDADDAADRVEALLRRTVPRGAEDAHSGLPMTVLGIRETGHAVAAGFLKLVPTGAAAHWRGMPPIDKED